MHFNQKDKKCLRSSTLSPFLHQSNEQKYRKLKFHFKYNCVNNLSLISSDHLKTYPRWDSDNNSLFQCIFKPSRCRTGSVRLAYTKTYENTSDLVFDSYYSRSPRPNTRYSIDPAFEPPSIDHHRMICLWLESWMSIGDRIYKLNQTSRPDISQETEHCTKDEVCKLQIGRLVQWSNARGIWYDKARVVIHYSRAMHDHFIIVHVVSIICKLRKYFSLKQERVSFLIK